MSTASTLHIQDPDGPHLHRASDFPSEPIKWLWPGRIPIGSITLLAGDPGAGKSLFAIDLAARVSTGAPWPDELPPPFAPSATTDSLHPPQPNACDLAPNPQSTFSGSRPSTLDSRLPGSVLILSASDFLPDTIRPRLDAAGADPARVIVVGNITNLRTEMERLHAAIDATPDLRLLVIDPINFYVGPGDAHFQTVVRTVLQPLAELARQRGFAILAVTHFRKNDGAAIQRAAGSMGFVATARAIWTITQDPEDESRRYLVPLKNNLTAPTVPLSFQITDEMTNDECPMTNDQSNGPPLVIRHSEIRHSPSAPHLLWDPTAACGLASPPRKPAPSTPRAEAQAFLREALANGPRPASDLIDEADARGFSRRTIQRAFQDLEGHTMKRGYRAGWWWSLGEYPIAPVPDDPLAILDFLLAEPTYANDIAAKISETRLYANLARQVPNEPAATPSPKPVSPSPGVSPSQKSAPKPAPASSAPLSPSQPLSPSPAPVNSNLPPSKNSPAPPLRAFTPHLHRPHPEPDQTCLPPTAHPRPTTNPQSELRNPKASPPPSTLNPKPFRLAPHPIPPILNRSPSPSLSSDT